MKPTLSNLRRPVDHRRRDCVRRALLFSALCFACTENRHVGIDFATDEGGFAAFSCIDRESERPGPLWSRGTVAGERRVELNLVVDFVSLGGIPDCRNSQLQDWCDEHDCEPLLPYRTCTTLNVPLDPDLSFEESLALALEGIQDTPIAQDAPDEPVLVRVVATVQSCEEAMASADFPYLDVAGCVFSCPTILDKQEANLLLDMQFGTSCVDSVRWCSSSDFQYPME